MAWRRPQFVLCRGKQQHGTTRFTFNHLHSTVEPVTFSSKIKTQETLQDHIVLFPPFGHLAALCFVKAYHPNHTGLKRNHHSKPRRGNNFFQKCATMAVLEELGTRLEGAGDDLVMKIRPVSIILVILVKLKEWNVARPSDS